VELRRIQRGKVVMFACGSPHFELIVTVLLELDG
jgi:hypothetical protein